ncbi:hypothetical protein BGAL_0090g00110 [Botrytis galanthina]|uniref:2EXR domain-containing protein n=1 Tax=Botrytis galanthina TaxID=278940 RepID=A0A4S8RCD1_9HELO|nr:hypothetical protein BGAL_0090g00110 [Botrytis galanthina]
MSILSSNAVPRENGVIYHSMSLFFNKTHSKSRYRPLPQKGGLQFMEFPPEIRRMIWELTIEQRLVEVRFENYELYANKTTHDFVADVPIALHICRESRNFAMGHYELAFDHDGAITPAYFNLKLDILYPRASCSEEQLRFLANNMDRRDCERVTYLAMYNEHLERTRSLSTWRALPLRFPNLDTFMVLFKSFVDPKTVDEKTLPPCKNSKVWESLFGREADTATGLRNPARVQIDRNVFKERIRAYLQPPVHWCQRDKKQKGHSRRTHFLCGRIMRKDPMHSQGWAMEKAHCYSQKLHKAARGSRWVWQVPELAVLGFCEHGLEFEEAPGLAYKGKFFRHFDDQRETIKKLYKPGTVTGNVKSQKDAEENAIIEARRKEEIAQSKAREGLGIPLSFYERAPRFGG